VRGDRPSTPVRALLAEADLVVLAGTIEMAGGAPVSNVAVFRMPPAAAPAGLTRSLSGNTVTLGWRHTGPPASLAYVVEAGTAPGAVDVGRFPVGLLTNVSGGLPNGTYYLRVRSVTAAGDSRASGEAVTTIPAPMGPPGPPGPLVASVAGSVVTLTWGAAAGNATSYVIEAGTAAGLTNIGVLPTGNLDTWWSVAAPSGTYVVRVRAANAFGQSPATNDVTVVVP
jgi:predicted phage tail protein